MVNPDVNGGTSISQAVECGYADGYRAESGAVLADIDMAGAECRPSKHSYR